MISSVRRYQLAPAQLTSTSTGPNRVWQHQRATWPPRARSGRAPGRPPRHQGRRTARRRRPGFRLERGDEQPGSLLGQRERDRAADAAAGTGDDADGSMQSEIQLSSVGRLNVGPAVDPRRRSSGANRSGVWRGGRPNPASVSFRWLGRAGSRRARRRRRRGLVRPSTRRCRRPTAACRGSRREDRGAGPWPSARGSGAAELHHPR